MDTTFNAFRAITESQWDPEEKGIVEKVLESLDIKLEVSTYVVWIGNIGEFPKGVLESPIVRDFLAAVRNAVSKKLEEIDLDPQPLIIERVVKDVREKFLQTESAENEM